MGCTMALRRDALLAIGGFTDWLDGKLARVLDQYSRFGAMLDPAVDRLYILAALVGLALRDIVPWWAVVAQPPIWAQFDAALGRAG